LSQAALKGALFAADGLKLHHHIVELGQIGQIKGQIFNHKVPCINVDYSIFFTI